MYPDHWGIHQSPFRPPAGASGYFASPTHEEALARIEFLVEGRYRLGILSGPSGMGKSLLLDMVAGDMRRSGAQVARANLTGLSEQQFLGTLATELRAPTGAQESVYTAWRAINDQFTQLRYQQLRTVILLDDLDDATTPVLAQLLQLLQTDRSGDWPLTFLLAGDLHPGRTLPSRLLDRVLDLGDLRIELDPWDAEVVGGYLGSCLERAGCQGVQFAPAAVARMAARGRGRPRQIARLAELSLVAATAVPTDQIEAELVESVFLELTGAGCWI